LLLNSQATGNKLRAWMRIV